MSANAARATMRAQELMANARANGNIGAADQAVSLLREVALNELAGDREMARAMTNLGYALHVRFNLSRDAVDLDEAVHFSRLAVEYSSSAAASTHASNGLLRNMILVLVDRLDRRSPPLTLNNLSARLYARYQHRNDPSDLNESIDSARRAVAAAHSRNPRLPQYLDGLRNALLLRFQRFGRATDLDAAVDVGQRALHLIGPLDSEYPQYASTMSNTLRMRFQHRGQPDDLAAALDTAQRAVDTSARDTPERASHLNHLANAFMVRFLNTTTIVDLYKAVSIYRLAVAAAHYGHHNHAMSLNNLGHALGIVFDHRRDPQDLEEAILLGERAISVAAPTDSALPGYFSTLGNNLGRRYGLRGDPHDLDAAVHHGEFAVRTTTPTDASLHNYLSGLGSVYLARYEHSGALKDLDRAVTARRQAVDVVPFDHPMRAGHLSNLSSTLHALSEQSGRVEHIDYAIHAGRQSLDATAGNHPSRAGRLNNLMIAYLARYTLATELADLNETIRLGREAERCTPPNHELHAGMSNNLGLALRARYVRTDNLDDLRDAVDLARDSVVTTSADDHRYYPMHSSNLGMTLLLRFDRLDTINDLHEAVLICHQAVDSAPVESPDRAKFLFNLAVALSSRFGHTSELNDANEAVLVALQAVAAAVHNSNYRAFSLLILGSALRDRFASFHDPADLTQASLAFQEGATLDGASLETRCTNAENWGNTATELKNWSSATTAYTHAIDLLPQLAGPSLLRVDREHHLKKFENLASRAAQAALRTHDVATALSLLEQGRGVLVAQALEARDDLARLREDHPELAQRYLYARDALARETTIGPGLSVPRRLPDTDANGRRRWLDTERRCALAEIRQLPGYATFLLPPTTPELAALAVNGPIVGLTVGADRATALICTATADESGGITGHVEAVELPAVNATALAEHVRTFQSATRPGAWGRNAKLRTVLGWLWEYIVEPVLTACGYHTAPQTTALTNPPQLWWMPTGALTLLPLHAAGHYPTLDEADHGTRPWGALDMVISSYTPTLRALQFSRTARHSTNGPGSSPLVVGIDETIDRDEIFYPALRFAVAEAERVQELLAAPYPALLNWEATRTRVLTALPHTDIAHFACHAADTDPDKPSDGHLVLHDESLSITDIVDLHLTQARLAYLSACGTAEAGNVLLDEAIHIAGAFHLAGFTHVIGTLWPIGDALAQTITDSIYTDLGGDPDRAAHATYQAVRSLYQRHPGEPRLWAAHIHIGP